LQRVVEWTATVAFGSVDDSVVLLHQPAEHGVGLVLQIQHAPGVTKR
jgi:hypothetical protein